MTPRGAAIQGGLALSGLLLAYATWQREPERATGEVVILEATKSDLQKVRFEDGAKWSQLGLDKGGLWLDTAARTEEPKLPARRVRASESGARFFERFAPLRAQRGLGKLAADKLKEVGLGAPKKKLLLTVRGETRTFLVGDSPFGVSDPYLRDERDGNVYVLGGNLLSDLEAAAVRFVDRTLHEFQPGEVDTLTVSSRGKQRTLAAVGGESGLAFARLSAPATPDKSDEQAKLWHDKVWRLTVTDVLGEGEKPTAGEPVVGLRVDYAKGGKGRGFVELGRVTPAAPPPPVVPDGGVAPPTPPPAPELYARTERTVSWVRVASGADDALKEAEKIVAGP